MILRDTGKETLLITSRLEEQKKISNFDGLVIANWKKPLNVLGRREKRKAQRVTWDATALDTAAQNGEPRTKQTVTSD